MFGIDIDDSPDHPVSTPQVRRTVAIHWNWTTDYTKQDMAKALGVRPETISRYLSDGPTDKVKEQMDGVEAEVRMVAVAELKEQLQQAGHRSRTAEKPVKVWTDDNGNLNVKDKIDPDSGAVTAKYPVPQDMELGPDGEARFYARKEVREILAQLVGITGAAEPEQKEVEHSGEVDGFNFTISPAAASDSDE